MYTGDFKWLGWKTRMKLFYLIYILNKIFKFYFAYKNGFQFLLIKLIKRTIINYIIVIREQRQLQSFYIESNFYNDAYLSIIKLNHRKIIKIIK